MIFRTTVAGLLILAAQLLALTVGGPADAAPMWQPGQATEDGIPVVLNPAEARDAEQVLAPEEQWRLGGDDESDLLFGLVSDAVVDEDGVTYLLDNHLSSIYVISPEGELLRTIGREGDGPGEFRNGTELVFMPNGTLGVLEMMPGKIVCMDRQGIPQPSFAFAGEKNTGMSHLQHIDATADQVVIGMVATSFGDERVVTEYSLSAFQPDGTLQAVLMTNEDVQSGGMVQIRLGGGENDFVRSWSLCPDGRVVVFQKAFDYELEVFDDYGKPQQIIRRQYETIKRPEQEIARSRKEAEDLKARFPQIGDEPVEERARDISGVVARPNGEIWVTSSQGSQSCPEQSVGVFDVFDQLGHYVRTLRIEADFDRDRDLYAVDGEHLFIFKEAQKAPQRSQTSGGGGMMMVTIGGSPDEDEDEDEEPRPYEVVCYRLIP